jgi:hypothetical protein
VYPLAECLRILRNILYPIVAAAMRAMSFPISDVFRELHLHQVCVRAHIQSPWFIYLSCQSSPQIEFLCDHQNSKESFWP